MSKVIVVGGGAAGLMAAYAAAANGHSVIILERNEKCGKKIYITGKGRCNLTNACDEEDFFDKIVTNSKFMYSSFYSFSNHMAIDLFQNELKLPVKIERGNRIFPESDKASDVTAALLRGLRKYNTDIRLNCFVKELIIENNVVRGVVTDTGAVFADSVILATGGSSYASTGSDGNGYTLAIQAGHSIQAPEPALVPMNTIEQWPPALQGLALKNVRTTFKKGSKTIFDEQGEMLFTHFGISGPLILTASSYIGRWIGKETIHLYIDCKPALSIDGLEARIQKDFDERPNVRYKNSLGRLLPAKMISTIVELSGISGEKQVNAITKEERSRLAALLKNLKITIKSLRGFNEAIITRGGVNVKEVNPSTLESKLCRDLYFAGELLDIDAVTGGYNLQVAWSTGHLAGAGIE